MPDKHKYYSKSLHLESYTRTQKQVRIKLNQIILMKYLIGLGNLL